MFKTSNNSIFSNKYGAIQKRLTINDYFDGEAAVSPSGATVVYSSFVDNDYELFKMNTDGKDQKRVSSHCKYCNLHKFQLTNKLGFEGGVAFSPDGKLIAYYASRPNTTIEIDKYKVKF